MFRIFTILLFSIFMNDLVLASNAILEREFTNHAWGYVHHGCLIDENGFAYTYSSGSYNKARPMEMIGRLSEKELKLAKELLKSIAKSGTFSTHHVSYDRGKLLYSGINHGTKISLKMEGDFAGINSASETTNLVKLIDKVCNQ